MKRSIDLEKEAVIDVAQLMAAAARTAPKTRGIDNIEIIAIDDEETKDRLIRKMRELSISEKRPSLERDANAIAGSHVILVVGVKSKPGGLNCGFCGYRTCEELQSTKGICAYNSIDLGIAVSSAISIASQFHIDNRVMYSIGLATLELKLFSENMKQALGIPLSVSGKNPFFYRK
ncbi:MAG: ferredoxin [Candidatus Omnitrophica bacterium]|nr:ferredoxin [Candidatus Omnitrophota bacterium]